MSSKVRVRFAPSPTGPLHVGGLRTALFNYLFAKQHGGTFILRIEDTDQKRYVPGAEAYIIDSLDWCHIPADESPKKPGQFGPYRQSERREIYGKWVKTLVDNGSAYFAFDTNEELDKLRKDQESLGQTFIYNFSNRGVLCNSLTLTKEDVQIRMNSGQPYVIRFKAPQDRTLEMTDMIRGNIAIDCNTLDDKILFKSDGMPTYHLANVVDDHLMEITHVIRGEEWLPSMALHILLYEAFGWKKPEFAHLPLILKPSGNGKLSKRDGNKLGFPVFPLDWDSNDSITKGFKGAGYLPEALLNFLGLLGWNPGTDQEIFNLDEMARNFSIGGVNKGGARFDIEKLNWFNQQYLAQMPLDELLLNIRLRYPSLSNVSDGLLTKILTLTQERLAFVDDFWSVANYFFEAPSDFNENAFARAVKADTSSIIESIRKIVETQDDCSPEALQLVIKERIVSQNIGFGIVMQPLRLALVGDLKGPDVFEIMSLLGKEEVCSRLARFQDRL